MGVHITGGCSNGHRRCLSSGHLHRAAPPQAHHMHSQHRAASALVGQHGGGSTQAGQAHNAHTQCTCTYAHMYTHTMHVALDTRGSLLYRSSRAGPYRMPKVPPPPRSPSLPPSWMVRALTQVPVAQGYKDVRVGQGGHCTAQWAHAAAPLPCGVTALGARRRGRRWWPVQAGIWHAGGHAGQCSVCRCC